MVTAVDPDLNVLEMAFDDYLCKPLSRETLAATIDSISPHVPTRDTTTSGVFSVPSRNSTFSKVDCPAPTWTTTTSTGS
jgi:two-component SAPR family response regulator